MFKTIGVTISVVGAMTLVACSGDSGSPTAPSGASATTISGTARIGSSASAQRAQLSSPRRGALDDVPSGLRVCVVGTDLCVEVGDTGAFELAGDFDGDVELHFVGPGQDVRVTLQNVQAGDIITVTIVLNGRVGEVEVDSRRHGGGQKVRLCHLEGNGTFHPIEVDPSAVDAHLRHGDGEPGGPVPDDDGLMFDDNCGIVGDEPPPPADPDDSEDEDDQRDRDDKVEICHRTGNGRFRLLEVSPPAVPAHMAHGDALPGEAVPGDPTATLTLGCIVVAPGQE